MSYDRKIEPREITQGERVAWTRNFSDYPATAWTLEYRFAGLVGTGNAFKITATADGSSFDAILTAAMSLAASVTQYGWQAWFTNISDPTDIVCGDNGLITVKRGMKHNDTTAIDTRTPAKIMLDAIDAALLAFAKSDIQQYEMSTPAGMKRVWRSDKLVLTSERKYWAGIVTNEIAREGAKKGKPLMKSIKMRVFDR